MIVNADARFIPLADESVNCIVTSPPYYGLRDYGISGQIGLEVTPDEYIANLVEVFRECKRILRDDGTLWVNIGDSYNGNTPNQSGQNGYNDGRENRDKRYSTGGIDGLKPKDLIGIPWMLAFALRADGWYLRQDIIWAKPNPMPESVKDRCTKSHEYIFLLSKSARYYYDNEAVKEPVEHPEITHKSQTKTKGQINAYLGNAPTNLGRCGTDPSGRNKRDVWTVTTRPYKGAHYATFNPDLIKPCILAGAPETCCAKCGAPYERVVEKETKYSAVDAKSAKAHDRENGDGYYRPNSKETGGVGGLSKIVNQYIQPTCTCNAGKSSGIVFDPFVGSGTTVMVARELGRRGIGLDLNMKYLDVNARERLASVQPLIFA